MFERFNIFKRIKDPMDPRISLISRVKLKLKGSLYVGEKGKSGIPYYLFECPHHGLVESYPQGYHKRLECPLCRYPQPA